MKIEDYGKKLADLKNESQRKVADLKEDQNEIVTSKNENLKKKVSEIKSKQNNEVQNLQDRYDSELKSMAEKQKEKYQDFNRYKTEENNELKENFLNTNKTQRKEFNDRISELNQSYNTDLGEQKKQSGIKYNRLDEIAKFRSGKDELRHQNEMNYLKDSTAQSMKKNQELFARDKSETSAAHQTATGAYRNQSEQDLIASKTTLNNEMESKEKLASDKFNHSRETNLKDKNISGLKHNQKIEKIMQEREREVSDIEKRFNQDRKNIADETNQKYRQNLDALERNYYNNKFQNENVYREGIELKEIENENMKATFEERQKISQKQFSDEINKLTLYQDQKMEMERENMRRDSFAKENDFKTRINEMRGQFNRELSKLRDKNKENLTEVTTRYEERIKNMQTENARESERKNLLQRQEIQNLVENSKKEKKDMAAYYESRLKNTGPTAKANQGLNNKDQKVSSNAGLAQKA